MAASPPPTTECATAAHVDDEVLKWVHIRVGKYVADRVLRGDRFYKRWDIRDVVYNITQLLDYTVQTCLYLAVNNNRQCGATQRSHSVIGFNRNPVESITARSTRHGPKSKQRGWTLLVYVVIDKRDFSKAAMASFTASLTAHKRLEAKVLEIAKFGIAHGAPVRIDHSICERGSQWFMPEVQRYLSRHPQFVKYACALAGATPTGPTPHSARS